MVFAALLFVAGCSSAIQVPPKLPEDGEVRTTETKLGMGSGISWKTTFKLEGDSTIPFQNCVLECEGKKHTKHSDCDSSCDKKCPSMHIDSVYSSLKELGEGNDPPKVPHAKGLDEAYSKFGFPSTWHAEDALKFPSFLPNARGFVLSLEHWNKKPCSSVTMSLKAKVYVITVEYQLFDDTKELDGTVKRELGPKGTIRFRATVLTGKDDTVLSDPSVNCKCEVKQEKPKTETGTGHGFVPGLVPEVHYAYVKDGGTERPITGNDIPGLVTNVSVEDMNYATFTYNTSWKEEFMIPAGWELECLTGGGQDVQIADDFFFAAAVGFGHGPFVDERRMRVFCLNIDKPEPAPGMQYRLVPPRNAMIQRAAALTRESRFRGPVDQMRLWIATDHAPYGKIAKVLVPTPAPSAYVTEMYRLDQVGAINSSDPPNLAIMEMALAFAPQPDVTAVDWMLRKRISVDTRKACSELRKAGPAIAASFADNPMDALDVVEACARSLALYGGDAGLETAVWLLETGVPEVHRKATLEPCGGIVAYGLSYATDASVVGGALAFFERTRPVGAAGGLASMNPVLPESLRKRGEALSKSLWPGRAITSARVARG